MADLRDYYNDLNKFIRKHGSYREKTSLEGNTQRKMILFEDGSTWYECSRKVYETARDTVKGVKVEFNVELFETEWWSDDNTTSKKMYDRY